MTWRKFTPVKPAPKSATHSIRIDQQDWEKIERIAGDMDISTSQIVRQAIHFAMESTHDRS